MKRLDRVFRMNAGKILFLAYLFFFIAVPLAHAQSDDLDAYTFRIDGLWWYAKPTGSFNDNSGGTFNLSRDFGFDYNTTFAVTLDWKFTRRQHLLFGVSSVDNSHGATLARTITFQGQTFNVGTQASANLQAQSFSPGYQFDFIRRNHGYLGVAAQFYLLNNRGTINGTVIVNSLAVARSASGSLLAPLPVLGLRGRWYPLHNSPRLWMEGFANGMYFFGYGNFSSARGLAGVGLTHHLSLTGGYQLGSRFDIHGISDSVGVRLTQKGPVAGLEFSW